MAMNHFLQPITYKATHVLCSCGEFMVEREDTRKLGRSCDCEEAEFRIGITADRDNEPWPEPKFGDSSDLD